MSTRSTPTSPTRVKRVASTHEALRAAKERHKAVPDRMLQDTVEFVPPASVRARDTRHVLAGREPADRSGTWSSPTWPGHRRRSTARGPRCRRCTRSRSSTDGLGLNITVFSYRGHIDIGIVADREQVPDVWKLIGLAPALARRAPDLEDVGRRQLAGVRSAK